MHKIFDSIEMVYDDLNTMCRYKDNGVWAFGEWFGNRCSDNCLYFANFIAAEHNDIPCVWVARHGTDLSRLHPRIRVYEMNKPETDDIVKNAHFLFMNQGFCDLTDNYKVISGPISVNFWHGVPWKKIGMDGAKEMSRIKRLYYGFQNKMLAADYFLSLSDEFTQILQSSCFADEKRIIKSGYPRNSMLYDKDLSILMRKRLLKYLEEKYHFDYDINTLKIVTYMPTFRDGNTSQFSFADFYNHSSLADILCKRNAIVIQKSHYISRDIQEDKLCDRVLFENDYPSQELLASTDLLITDYSSCFFDFLICDRPIIHYIYDYDYYSTSDRGLYYGYEDVCGGDVVLDEQGLLKAIERNLDLPAINHDLRLSRKATYMKYESIDSCSRIFEFLNKL